MSYVWAYVTRWSKIMGLIYLRTAFFFLCLYLPINTYREYLSIITYYYYYIFSFQSTYLDKLLHRAAEQVIPILSIWWG